MASHRITSSVLCALVGFALSCSEPSSRVSDASAGADGRDAASEVFIPADTLASPTTTVSVHDGRARWSLAAAPLRLSVERANGTVWFASGTRVPFLEIGTRPGGSSPLRFSDPRVHDPQGITWISPPTVLSESSPSASARSLVLGEGSLASLTATLSLGDLGSARVEIDACALRDAAMIRVNLAADDGGYHGLGERFGRVDARGQIVPMQLHVDTRFTSGTNEAHVPVPFLVSTLAYGMFMETREAGAFDVGATDPSRVSATFEGCRATLHFYTNETPIGVIEAYTLDSGGARSPPEWVFGPMHWRNVWRSSDEALDDARRLRAERIPTTTLWIDNPWEASYNDHEFDRRRFPDPPGLIRELTRMGFKVLLWSTPYLDAVASGATPSNTAERLFVEARDQGFLLRLSDGSPFVSPSTPGSAGGMPNSQGALVDFSNPAARDFWTRRIEPLVTLGIRGFKLDYGEDVVPEIAGIRPRVQFSTGETERTGGRSYPQGYHQSYQDAFIRRSGSEGFLLVRASSYGGQRIADVVWPGDLDNDFRRHENGEVGGLPAAVHAMQTLSVSGFPAFGSDTGGYRGGRPTREALLRWAEHTALSPVMQLGGGGESHNPWSYEPDATETYRGLARLHNDLVPYFRILAQAATRDGTPTVRPMAIQFPNDPGARDEDSYMLGDDLMVAPVVEPGVTSRRVHIPQGTWVHWFDQRAFTGPMDVTVPAPLGRPALFMRQGAVIPMMPSDVETLSVTDDPSVIDESDRAGVLRARVIPAGSGIATERGGSRIGVTESPGRIELDFAPVPPVEELRAELDLAHRGSPSALPITRVTRVGGPALSQVSTPDSGCRDCWHYDGPQGLLRINVRGPARLTVEP